MQTLTFKDAVSLTTTLARNHQPVLCHGQPGIGKTQGWAEEVAAQLDAQLRVFTPSHHDPVAVNGLPVPDLTSGTTQTLVNGFFADLTADKNPPKTVVLLDEIGQLTPAQQAPLMRLVLERKVADKELHKNVYLIAATNRLQDGAMTQRMATPLRNRFAHFELVPDLDQWATAVASNYEQGSLLAGFLKWKPHLFNTFDEACKDPATFAFATPRTWEGVLKVWGAETPATTLRHLTTSLVGETPAVELETFVRVHSRLPDFDAVADGAAPNDTKKLDWADPALQYACATAVASFTLRTARAYDMGTINDGSAAERLNRVLTFAFDLLTQDVRVFAAKVMFDTLRAQELTALNPNILALKPIEGVIDRVVEVM